jgi:hypothetical protein
MTLKNLSTDFSGLKNLRVNCRSHIRSTYSQAALA